jgi:adenylate cyclase
MGDGVNVAARLEGTNKDFGTLTCVSHQVFREAGERLCLRPIDTITVKGRKGELLVYDLLGILDGDEETRASANEVELCEMTKDAYAFYSRGDKTGAISGYSAILEKFPNDKVAQRMLEKSQAVLG